MKLLIFVCVLVAAEAAKLQGYVPPNPQGFSSTRNLESSNLETSAGAFPNQQLSTFTGVPLPTVTRPQITAPAGLFQSTGSNQQPSVSNIGSVSAHPDQSSDQPDQLSGQSFSSSDQQSIGSGQLFSSQQSSGSNDQANFSPIEQFQSANNQEILSRDSLTSTGIDSSDEDCSENQVRHVDGRCVTPEVTRNVFVYAMPETERSVNLDQVDIPLPKIEHNIVFIRTDKLNSGNDPIIVPPPQRKHIIYVLNKESEFGGQRVIEVTAPPPKNPEVYFVNYAEGETPTLPDGVDFETALNSAVHGEGQVIGGSSNFRAGNEDDSNDFNGAEVANSFVNGVGPSTFIGNGAGAINRFVDNGAGAINRFVDNGEATNRFVNNGEATNHFVNNGEATNHFVNNGEATNGFVNVVEATNGFVNDVEATNLPINGVDNYNGNIGFTAVRGSNANVNNNRVAPNEAGSTAATTFSNNNGFSGNTADPLVSTNNNNNNNNNNYNGVGGPESSGSASRVESFANAFQASSSSSSSGVAATPQVLYRTP